MSSFLNLVSSVSKTKAIAACAATSFSATVVLYSVLQSTGERGHNSDGCFSRFCSLLSYAKHLAGQGQPSGDPLHTHSVLARVPLRLCSEPRACCRRDAAPCAAYAAKERLGIPRPARSTIRISEHQKLALPTCHLAHRASQSITSVDVRLSALHRETQRQRQRAFCAFFGNRPKDIDDVMLVHGQYLTENALYDQPINQTVFDQPGEVGARSRAKYRDNGGGYNPCYLPLCVGGQKATNVLCIGYSRVSSCPMS